MGYPDGYSCVHADQESIAKARKIKENLDLSWSDFFERGATELTATGE